MVELEEIVAAEGVVEGRSRGRCGCLGLKRGHIGSMVGFLLLMMGME